MSSVNFAFFGTPEPAVEILDALKLRDLLPSLIVTNPDKPQGRKMALTPPPVKVWAQKNGIKFLQPEKLDSVFNQQLTTYNPQLFIVVAYGAILPRALLDIPKRGSLNVHYSLLPKYRGASPVESQILADDKDVGVSILLLDEKMDHGPIVAQRRLQIPDWPLSAEALRSAMNNVAGELLAESLSDWIAGKIEAKPQDHSKATYTKKFTKADCEIDLSADPYANFLKIQALGAWGPYFFAEKNGGKTRVSIKSSAYREGTLVLLRVVPEGKKEMSYEEFVRGLK